MGWTQKHRLTDSRLRAASTPLRRLLFHAQTALMAQPFDPDSGRLFGEPTALIDGVQFDPGVWRMVASVSETGTMVYIRGSAVLGSELAWFDRTGKEGGARETVDTALHVNPAWSPDGRWLAYASNESGRSQVYVTSFPGGSGKWQVSSLSGDMPAWRRDGKELDFASGSELQAADVNAAGSQFNPGTPRTIAHSAT